MMLKKKTAHAIRVVFAEIRPNSGTPSAPDPIDWAVSHASAFPWLNTITFLPDAGRRNA